MKSPYVFRKNTRYNKVSKVIIIVQITAAKSEERYYCIQKDVKIENVFVNNFLPFFKIRIFEG
ncbi:hypothetical protein D3C80_1336140 [compost metagenome]